jgi:hypothetical protein
MRAFFVAMLAFAALPAGANPKPAAVRNRVCQPCRLPNFPVALPRHGVVLARSGGFGLGPHFLLLDLDRAVLSRTGRFSREDGGAAGAHARDIVLTPDELLELRVVAEKIWAEPDALPSNAATDVRWDAWLSDGAAMRREGGPGNPPGLAEELEKRMLAIVWRHEAAAATGR